MTMPRSVSNRVNVKSFGRQEEPFNEFGGMSVSRNGTNGKTHNKIIQDPKERLLALTNTQKRVVRAVRRFPGSNSVTISNSINIVRHQALQYSSVLADELGVLKSDKYDPRRGGRNSKKPIHFWLADDIPAELVDAILGNLDVDPDVILANQSRRSKAKIAAEEHNEDVSSFAVFSALTPAERELAVTIAQAGSKGIGAPELSRLTNQKMNRIYDKLKKIVGCKLVDKQLLPGFKNQSVYCATAELLEVIKQLSSEQPEDVQASPDSNVDEDNTDLFTMPPRQSPSTYSSEDAFVQPTEESNGLWNVLTVMAQRLKSLEKRFARMEASLQGKGLVKANEILEMLNSEDD